MSEVTACCAPEGDEDTLSTTSNIYSQFSAYPSANYNQYLSQDTIILAIVCQRLLTVSISSVLRTVDVC